MMKPPIDQRYACNDLGIGLAIGAATANASGELMFASGKVIALRAALGVRGMADPANADHGELARILPEKLRSWWQPGLSSCSDRAK